MRIVSTNLNQRLGNAGVRLRFETWLAIQVPDLLVAQEPFKRGQPARPQIAGYRLIGTTPLVSCWIREHHGTAQVIEHSERWQEVRLSGLGIHNVYLSAHSSKDRCDLLLELADTVGRSGEECLVLGDFNLAPRLDDGLFGDKPSAFTKATERRALATLITAKRLVDSTCPAPGSAPEFTLERTVNGQSSRFRCDLALLSACLRDSVSVAYDHSVRTAAGSFTDHSAIVVELKGMNFAPSGERNLSPPRVPARASESRPSPERASPAAASHKTAIKRRGGSQIARKLHEGGILTELYVRSILDFGCGYGADVHFYRQSGYQADGFDIEPRFGWERIEDREYDLVTVVFVINVLPSVDDRLSSIRAAARFVRPGGHLLIAARSESAIAGEALRGSWAQFNDGWISAPSKGTFQKGIPTVAIERLIGAVGFQIVECALRLSSDVSWLLGRRSL